MSNVIITFTTSKMTQLPQNTYTPFNLSPFMLLVYFIFKYILDTTRQYYYYSVPLIILEIDPFIYTFIFVPETVLLNGIIFMIPRDISFILVRSADFCLFGQVFLQSSLLNDSFTGQRILGWILVFLTTLQVAFLFLLNSTLSVEKSAAILTICSLKAMPFSSWQLFSLF